MSLEGREEGGGDATHNYQSWVETARAGGMGEAAVCQAWYYYLYSFG